MKEFFVWYLIASIIGVWSILAYGFYRMSKIETRIHILKKIVFGLIELLKKEAIEKESAND